MADHVIFIDDFAVISHKAEIFSVVVKRIARADDTSDNLIIFIIGKSVGFDKTDGNRIKIRYIAAGSHTADKFARLRNHHFGGNQAAVQNIFLSDPAISITVRRNETDFLPLQIGIETVTGQAADSTPVIRIDQTGEQHGTGYVEKVINNQAVRQHFCNNLSRSQTNGAVVIYFTERFIVVADGNTLRNNAADDVSVKIGNQAVGGYVANQLVVKTDDLTVGNNFTD